MRSSHETSYEFLLKKIWFKAENLDQSDKVTISIDASPIILQWVEFDFTDMIVTPDDTYYIVVRADGGYIDNCYVWLLDVNNPYVRGEAWYSVDSGSNWYLSDIQDFPRSDHCFKTYGYNRNEPNISMKVARVRTLNALGYSW